MDDTMITGSKDEEHILHLVYEVLKKAQERRKGISSKRVTFYGHLTEQHRL